jgi:hypothetical protein
VAVLGWASAKHFLCSILMKPLTMSMVDTTPSFTERWAEWSPERFSLWPWICVMEKISPDWQLRNPAVGPAISTLAALSRFRTLCFWLWHLEESSSCSECVKQKPEMAGRQW